MRRCLSILILLLMFSAAPCAASQGAGKNSRQGNLNVEWLFRPLGLDQNTGLPRVKVFLVIGGRRVLIRDTVGSFRGLDREQYAGSDIPSKAIIACIGSEPGASTYMYVIRRKGWLVVYERYLDAQAQDDPAYRRLKLIPLR